MAANLRQSWPSPEYSVLLPGMGSLAALAMQGSEEASVLPEAKAIGRAVAVAENVTEVGSVAAVGAVAVVRVMPAETSESTASEWSSDSDSSRCMAAKHSESERSHKIWWTRHKSEPSLFGSEAGSVVALTAGEEWASHASGPDSWTRMEGWVRCMTGWVSGGGWQWGHCWRTTEH